MLPHLPQSKVTESLAAGSYIYIFKYTVHLLSAIQLKWRKTFQVAALSLSEL